MAPFSKYVSFLIFNALLLSLQINARESQFFSKVTHDSNNNFKETELPNKEVTVNKPEQEPVFTPETESYGLYGHESGQFPPSTTTTTTNDAPYTTTPTTYEPESEQETSKYTNKYYNKDTYEGNQNEIGRTRLTANSHFSNNNNNYDSKDAYGRNQNEFGNTRLTESSYTNNNNNNNNNYEYNKDAFEGNQNELADTKYTEGEYYSEKNQNNNNNNQNYHYTNAANYRKNGERQGMSDTRYVKHGQYYFHVPSKGVNSKNWNSYDGYFGNNNAKSYENNNNNMERYQNSEEFEDDEEP